jgi:hypothetical protein
MQTLANLQRSDPLFTEAQEDEADFSPGGRF